MARAIATTRLIELHNRLHNTCYSHSGGRNFSPQNSGTIMATIEMMKPIFNNRGHCRFVHHTLYIRGEAEVLAILNKIEESDLSYFTFMEITEVKPVYFGGKKTSNWEWVKLHSKEEVLNLLFENKQKLDWEKMRIETINNIINS